MFGFVAIILYIAVEAEAVDFLKKVTDFLMPIEEEVVKQEPAREEERDEVRASTASVFEESKVVNGSPLQYETMEPPQRQTASRSLRSSYTRQPHSVRPRVTGTTERPKLTVHTTQIPSLNVKIYVPRSFDQVPEIADDLKAGKAVLVNYERVELEEQRRICDFVNGVCYIMNGEVKRVSTSMVLYAPDGVNVYDAEPIPLEH